MITLPTGRACLLALLLLLPTRAQSQPSTEPSPPDGAGGSGAPRPYSLSYNFTVASRYLFQGIDYSESEPVAQLGIDVTYGPVTAKMWANHDLAERVSNEFDLSLEYGLSRGKYSGSIGYTHLHYPHRDGWDPSQETYVTISREGPVVASLSVRYDFDAGTGTWSTLGFSRSVSHPFGTVTVASNLFHQAGYYDASGFPSAELNLNVNFPIGSASLTPSVSRFLSWENGDFVGAAQPPSVWLFALSFAQEF